MMTDGNERFQHQIQISVGRIPDAIAKREKRMNSRPSTYTGYVWIVAITVSPDGEITSTRLATPRSVVAPFSFLRGVLWTPTSTVLSWKCGNVSLDV